SRGLRQPRLPRAHRFDGRFSRTRPARPDSQGFYVSVGVHARRRGLVRAAIINPFPRTIRLATPYGEILAEGSVAAIVRPGGEAEIAAHRDARELGSPSQRRISTVRWIDTGKRLVCVHRPRLQHDGVAGRVRLERLNPAAPP